MREPFAHTEYLVIEAMSVAVGRGVRGQRPATRLVTASSTLRGDGR
ncbi:hypothetical protein [Streptomyces sp. NPDC048473]